jgi:myosin-1
MLFVQMARGGLARRRCKQMRAIYLIMQRFKRYKMRCYVQSVQDRFRNVARSRDFGKSVQWPAPPAVLQGLVDMLKKVHARSVQVLLN